MRECDLEPFENERWHLNKALYGLRQSPAAWDDFFAKVMEELPSFAFVRLKSDPSVWYDRDSGVVLLKYVDDLLATGISDAAARFYAALEQLVAIEINSPLEVDDEQALLGRAITRRDWGFEIRVASAIYERLTAALVFRALLLGLAFLAWLRTVGAQTRRRWHPMRICPGTDDALAFSCTSAVSVPTYNTLQKNLAVE